MTLEPANADWVLNTSRDTFTQDVLERSVDVPVVVDFWAPWCGPCRALGPVLEKLAAEHAGAFVLVKANTDELQEAAAQFNVQGIPAVFGVVEGEVIDAFSGALPEAMVRQWLERLLETAAWNDAKRLEEISPAGAEAKYRALLERSPSNADAQIALARTLAAQDRFDECATILAALEQRGYLEPAAQKLKAALDLRSKQGADIAGLRSAAGSQPQNLALQLELAEALAAEQQYQEALDILLDLVQRDRKGTGESARQRMVEIFHALPDDSELTSEYRRKLSRALY